LSESYILKWLDALSVGFAAQGASAEGVDNLSRRFEKRDQPAADIRRNDVSLKEALESRSKESWDQELAEQVTAVSTGLAAVRQFSIVERDLDQRQKTELGCKRSHSGQEPDCQPVEGQMM